MALTESTAGGRRRRKIINFVLQVSELQNQTLSVNSLASVQNTQTHMIMYFTAQEYNKMETMKNSKQADPVVRMAQCCYHIYSLLSLALLSQHNVESYKYVVVKFWVYIYMYKSYPPHPCFAHNCAILTFASVPSTQYPATMTPFLLSVHHASKSCLERPLCIIPGLAIITHGPTSSNWSIL